MYMYGDCTEERKKKSKNSHVVVGGQEYAQHN
jgi:hypothetical protein